MLQNDQKISDTIRILLMGFTPVNKNQFRLIYIKSLEMRVLKNQHETALTGERLSHKAGIYTRNTVIVYYSSNWLKYKTFQLYRVCYAIISQIQAAPGAQSVLRRTWPLAQRTSAGEAGQQRPGGLLSARRHAAHRYHPGSLALQRIGAQT